MNQRIKALDGWRGIAILLVLADHMQWQWLGRYLFPWSSAGQHGVTLFFVLSGFLITSNLLRGPDLKGFYIRRFFRLMPAAWCYLFVLWFMSYYVPNGPSKIDFASCLLFFRNFIPHETFPLSTSHFWSLSMEEQFYLFWPCILIVAGRRRALWMVTGVAIACAMFRYAFWAQCSTFWLSFQSEVRADAICVGCVLAFACNHERTKAILARALDVLFPAALLVFSFCLVHFIRLIPLYECLAIAVLISAPVLRPDRIYARVFAFKPLAALGVISYSVYIWQEPFTRRYSPSLSLLANCLIPVFAIASYFILEKPFIAIGKRINIHSTELRHCFQKTCSTSQFRSGLSPVD